MSRLQGCGTALVTPFTADGSVDFPALRSLVDWQITEGIDFLVACGSTGEAQTLDVSEREQVVAAVLEAAGRRVPVMAGATSNDTATAVEETRRMCRLGTDYVLSATPYYNKPGPEGLFRHFTAVADATGDLEVTDAAVVLATHDRQLRRDVAGWKHLNLTVNRADREVA